MRTRFLSSIIVIIGLFVAAVIALAQAPRGAAPATQAPAYRAKRTKDGKPDFNGLWQAVNEANWDLEAHGAAAGPIYQMGAAFSQAPGLGIVEGGALPYKPQALQ